MLQRAFTYGRPFFCMGQEINEIEQNRSKHLPIGIKSDNEMV